MTGKNVLRFGMNPISSIESLMGNLYYSKKQWNKNRDEGRDRMFAKLLDGQIVEYTELISRDALKEDPGQQPLFEDAQMLGVGIFDHFRDEQGRKFGN